VSPSLGPRDDTVTETPSDQHYALARPEPYLIVALESDRPLSGSSRHCLRGVTEVLLGRGEERAVRREAERLLLSLASHRTSTRHARIVRTPAGFRLEDLGSRNGTWVNGRAIQHLVLRDGDLLEIGRTFAIFRESLHGPATTAPDFDSRNAGEAEPGLLSLLPGVADDFAALSRIARSKVPVLLRGETGTGKEVTARAVHALSRRTGPFVAVNCAAIPATLIESQLFGHAKGAFSGATRDEPGFVRAASAGTLFLDEIGDLPAASQAALLRVLQESEVVPVGTTRPVPVDLRVVAATNRPLEALVSAGGFRTDLLARLDGFTHVLPPLRERKEDLGLLVGALLRQLAPDASPTLSPDVARAMFRYRWPHNIRELGQCLARALTLAGNPATLERSHLPQAVSQELDRSPSLAPAPAPKQPETALQSQLEGLLVQHRGNVAEVARSMGKARMQIQRWMKRFSLDPNQYR
jgi:DNA-binding NtrC family response regulator